MYEIYCAIESEYRSGSTGGGVSDPRAMFYYFISIYFSYNPITHYTDIVTI